MTKTRRSANSRPKRPAQTPGEQVLVTAEFTALAFTIAAKNLLRNRHGWDDDAAEAFGAALWEEASKMMARTLDSAGKRVAQ